MSKSNEKYIVYYVGKYPDTAWILDESRGLMKLYGYWSQDEDNKNKRNFVEPTKSRVLHIDNVDKLAEVMKIDKKYIKVMNKEDFFLVML